MGLIAGIYTKNNDDNLNNYLNPMMACQAHRDNGPQTSYLNNIVTLGMVNSHNTILCGSNKIQTTEVSIENKSGIHAFVDGIVLEGLKHKESLEDMSYQKLIPTSSAMIEAAYEKWGLDFMSHLEGEFSCAIWDNNKKMLILARDPFGHKPLHYYSENGKFIFSSEIKGILAAGVTKEIDLKSVSDFLSLNCIPCPATIFKNIMQVPPGSMLILNNGDIKIIKYWSSELYEDKKKSFNDAVSEVKEALYNAIKKRILSDDIYCFLSGGIDSSAIVAFASEISSKPIKAISVGFNEKERNEIEDAAVLAKHVGAEHYKVIASPDSFIDMLDTIVFHHDSPFTDTSNYPSYYAAKLARGFTDKIITGDGPDQTMGGSGHHVFALKNDLFRKRSVLYKKINGLGAGFIKLLSGDPTPSILSKIERKLYRGSVTPVHAAYDLRSCFPNIVKRYLCTQDLWDYHVKHNPYKLPESWFEEAGEVDDINKYLYADVRFYVPDDLMVKVDRMCMAHGLETLSPFQDIGLAKIINSLPGNYKINVSESGEITTKYILKEVCKSKFPKHTLEKTKQGFGIPIEKWLRQDNGKTLKEILLDPRTLTRNYFKTKSMETLVNSFIKGKGDYFFPNAMGIVGLLSLELWHRKYID